MHGLSSVILDASKNTSNLLIQLVHLVALLLPPSISTSNGADVILFINKSFIFKIARQFFFYGVTTNRLIIVNTQSDNRVTE
ncbi:hypothetical protein BpHYR1_032659 [Brachionus plicatilis]|uniref:Uncharacterized protein n=1 Tax=Brachionus plicatilis TaxID=10195 RepID=A0A3M7R041_BRAPC|nr:hypothetical protein BpHYR1_032659 [Brachionus plicatilis]